MFSVLYDAHSAANNIATEGLQAALALMKFSLSRLAIRADLGGM